ncbi:MAG: TlpA family protein disulfide reductase [Thermoanaerobaculia bacterium]
MRNLPLQLLVTAGAVLGLALAAGAPARAAGSGDGDAPVLLGSVTRPEIEAAVPSWVAATADAAVDEEAATALAAVEPGGRVTVFLGTWCSDSRREVPRLWRALDQVGGLVPFDVEYVAVDEDKAEPAELVAGRDLRYVPTVIVSRGGEEVGRVVEVSPNGIEHDLLALLTGTESGVVTAREDL